MMLNIHICSKIDGSRLVGRWHEAEDPNGRRRPFQIKGGVGLVYLDTAYWVECDSWEPTDFWSDDPVEDLADKLAQKLEERQEARILEKNRAFFEKESGL